TAVTATSAGTDFGWDVSTTMSATGSAGDSVTGSAGDGSPVAGGGSDGPAERSGTDGPTGAPAQPELPTAQDICRQPSVVSVVSGVTPLHATTGLHLLAGIEPRQFDVDADTAGRPLLALPHGQYVTQVSTDGHGGAVAVVQACGSAFDMRVVHVDGDGHA